MARRKQLRKIDWPMIRMFEKEAVRFQKASICDCPETSRLNAMIARKYLFYIIDECQGQKP
jgi:hypothetical protein